MGMGWKIKRGSSCNQRARRAMGGTAPRSSKTQTHQLPVISASSPTAAATLSMPLSIMATASLLRVSHGAAPHTILLASPWSVRYVFKPACSRPDKARPPAFDACGSTLWPRSNCPIPYARHQWHLLRS